MKCIDLKIRPCDACLILLISAGLHSGANSATAHTPIQAQTPFNEKTQTDELVALGRKVGVGARAISLGEAFTAVADDYSALYYNPAGMAQLERSEFGINLGYGYTENISSLGGGPGYKQNIESTRLNALTLIMANGSRWALGLGYYSPTSFDDPLYYVRDGKEYLYRARGKMDHVRVGAANRISENLSMGLAASAISGREQLEIQDSASIRYIEDYEGFNLEPSLLIHLSEFFSLGASVVAFERLHLTDTHQGQDGKAVETHYDIHHPFQSRLGIAFQAENTQVSLDWHGDYWSSYSYSPEGAAFQLENPSYPNRHRFNLGLEQHMRPSHLVLRAGVSWEAEDGQPRPQTRQPYKLTAGLGFEPAPNLNMDLAYQFAGEKTLQNSLPGGPADLNISQYHHQILGAFRYTW